MKLEIGQIIAVPDGYQANGTSRPWRKAEVVREARMYYVAQYADTKKLVTIPLNNTCKLWEVKP